TEGERDSVGPAASRTAVTQRPGAAIPSCRRLFATLAGDNFSRLAITSSGLVPSRASVFSFQRFAWVTATGLGIPNASRLALTFRREIFIRRAISESVSLPSIASSDLVHTRAVRPF